MHILIEQSSNDFFNSNLSLHERLSLCANAIFSTSKKNVVQMIYTNENPNKHIENAIALASKHARSCVANSLDIQENLSNQIEERKMQAQVSNEVNKIRKQENLLYQGQQEDLNQYFDHCQCCGQLVGSQIPYCQNISKLTFFGNGVIAFLYFYLHLLSSLFFSYLLLSLYSIVTDLYSSSQHDYLPKCLYDHFCTFQFKSSAHLQESRFSTAEGWLGLSVSILFIVIFECRRFRSEQLASQQDSQVTTPSDFALIVQELPKGYSIKQLNQFLAKQFSRVRQNQPEQQQNQSETRVGRDVKINKVIHVLDMDSYSQAVSLLIQMTEEYFALETQERLQFTLQNQQSIKQLVDQLDSCHTQLEKREIRDKLTHAAIVVFQFKEDKDIIRKKLAQKQESVMGQVYMFLKGLIIPNAKTLRFNQSEIIVRDSFEPQDIIFKNFKHPASIMRQILYWSLTIISILICLGINIVLVTLRTKDQTNPNFNLFINYLFQIVVLILNSILNFLIPLFADRQYHYAHSLRELSFTNKALVSVVINTTFIPIITNILILREDVFDLNSTMMKAFSFALTNMIVPNLVLLVDPVYQIKQVLLRVECLVASKFNKLSTRQFNEMYEASQISMALNYQYALNFLYFGTFYLPLQPIVMVMAFVGIAFRYLIIKYLILRRCKRSKMMSFYYFRIMCDNLDYAGLFYGLGWIIFTLSLPGTHDIMQLLPGIIVAVLMFLKIVFYRFNFFAKLMKKSGIIQQFQERQNLGYSESVFIQNENYEVLNPAARVVGLGRLQSDTLRD